MRQRCGSPSFEVISRCSISRLRSTRRPPPRLAVIRTPMRGISSASGSRSGGDGCGDGLAVVADAQDHIEATLAEGGAADAPDLLDPGPVHAQPAERVVEPVGEAG